MSNHKYLIAPTGTNHIRKPGTMQSWCGRVHIGQPGVKGTNRTPDVLCKRDTMLSGMATQPADKPVAAPKTIKAPGTKGATGRKPVRAAQAVKATVKDRLSEGVADHALYYDLDAFLVANDSGPTYNHDLTGLTASFEYGDWVYTIRAPEFNANGPDDGWIIQYVGVEEAGSSEGVTVEDPLPTVESVIDWIREDIGFPKVPANRQKAATDSTPKALVVSHLVTIVSNAHEAAGLAGKAKLDASVVQALKDMKKAADDLRKVLNK